MILCSVLHYTATVPSHKHTYVSSSYSLTRVCWHRFVCVCVLHVCLNYDQSVCLFILYYLLVVVSFVVSII